MQIKPFINLSVYVLSGGINRKILYILLFILLYQYLWFYNTMKLDQFLKWQNLVSSGGEAKVFIKSGSVKVNGEIETRRGRKLTKGDKVMFLKIEIIFE